MLGESYVCCVCLEPNTMIFVLSVETVRPLFEQKSCRVSSMACSCCGVSALRVRSSAYMTTVWWSGRKFLCFLCLS